MSASIYKLAASVIRKSDTKRGSIKSLVFSSSTSSVQKKKLYALVCNTLKSEHQFNHRFYGLTPLLFCKCAERASMVC